MLEHHPRFDCWGSELTRALHPYAAQAAEQRMNRRRARIAWLGLSWLALVVAAASALTAHLAG